MLMATTVARVLVRIAGVLQLGLGLLFWTGNVLTLIPLHMLVGSVIVLLLWTLAGLAARAGAHAGLVLLALAWGVVVPVLGMTQTALLPGPLHWLVQVMHLLVGLVALALAETLARRILRPRATAQVEQAWT